jgi:hypothetical protein
MVNITTINIHPIDLSYLGDILMSSKFHTNVPISIYNYYASVENKTPINSNCFNIQLSAERKVSDNDYFILTLGHIQTLQKNRSVWFPYILNKNPQQYLLKYRIENTPKNFCCYVVFNHRCEMRNKFFDFVCDKYKKVDSLGKHKRNVSGEVIEKVEKYSIHDHRYLEILSDYKFMICFENESEPYYLTEKIANAWVAGCIPIYWGMKKVENILNSKAFIHIKDEEDFEYALKRIKEIDENDDLYNQMKKEPLFKDDKVPYFFTKDYYVKTLNECFDTLFTK